jgi:hypothetical protein
MRKKYGIFEINTKAKYLKDGLDSIEFLSQEGLYETEEDAIIRLPYNDGHYIIMPVYVKDDVKKYLQEGEKLNEFAKSLSRTNIQPIDYSKTTHNSSVPITLTRIREQFKNVKP